jgi:hypothetical protein
MESAPVNPEFMPINPAGEEEPEQLAPGPLEPEPQPLTQGGRRSRRRRSRSRRQSRKSKRTRRSRRR